MSHSSSSRRLLLLLPLIGLTLLAIVSYAHSLAVENIDCSAVWSVNDNKFFTLNRDLTSIKSICLFANEHELRSSHLNMNSASLLDSALVGLTVGDLPDKSNEKYIFVDGGLVTLIWLSTESHHPVFIVGKLASSSSSSSSAAAATLSHLMFDSPHSVDHSKFFIVNGHVSFSSEMSCPVSSISCGTPAAFNTSGIFHSETQKWSQAFDQNSCLSSCFPLTFARQQQQQQKEVQEKEQENMELSFVTRRDVPCGIATGCTHCVTTWSEFNNAFGTTGTLVICVNAASITRASSSATITIDGRAVTVKSALSTNAVFVGDNTITPNRVFTINNAAVFKMEKITFNRIFCGSGSTNIPGCIINSLSTSATITLDYFTCSGVKITSGTASYGTCINSNNILTITNSVFDSNTQAQSGIITTNQGVINTLPGSTLTVSSSTFTNNYSGKGGAIYAFDSNVAVVNCVFTNNTANPDTITGSAIHSLTTSKNVIFSVAKCKFTNNVVGSLTGSTPTKSGVLLFRNSGASRTLKFGVASSTFCGNTGSDYNVAVSSSGATTGSVVNAYLFNNIGATTVSTLDTTGSNYQVTTFIDVGTNAVGAAPSFCSTCGSVSTAFCNAFSSTINCTTSVSSEPVTYCPCTGGLYRNLETMACVTALNCPASAPLGDSINGVCTTPLGCSATSKPYGDITTRTCVSVCPALTAGDKLTHLCCRSLPSQPYTIPCTCNINSVGLSTNVPAACHCSGSDGWCTCTSTTVDCSNLNLPDFPSFSNAVLSVTSVKVGGNTFKTVPNSAFSRLTQLTSIDLSSGQINSIAAGAFSGLSALTSINLSNNALTSASFNPGSFNGMAGGVAINLSGNSGVTSGPGTYNNGGTITSCDPVCNTCYGPGSDKCCPANCMACTSSSTCTTCNTGFTPLGGACVSDTAGLTCNAMPLTNGVVTLAKFPITSISYGRACFVASAYSELLSGYSLANLSENKKYCCRSAGVLASFNGVLQCELGCSGFAKAYTNYAWVQSNRATDGDKVGSRCYVDCFEVYQSIKT